MHRFACKLDNWIRTHNAQRQAGREERKEGGKVGSREQAEQAREVGVLKGRGNMKDLCMFTRSRRHENDA